MNQVEFVLCLAGGIHAGKQLSSELWTQVSKPQGYEQSITLWNPRTFVNNTLRGIDFDVRLPNGEIKQLRMLEQNPNKQNANGSLTSYAQQARNGSQICWVIDRTIQNGGFLGRIQDGVFYPSQDPAYTTKTVQAVQTSQPVSQDRSDEVELDIDAIPDIPDHVTMSDYTDAQMDAIAEMMVENDFVSDYEYEEI
jgi:hypothetical protein